MSVGCMGVEEEIPQAFRNVEKTLATAGAHWRHVVHVNTYHVGGFPPEVNETMARLYRHYMPDHAPIWTEVGVTALGAPAMRFECASRPSFVIGLQACRRGMRCGRPRDNPEMARKAFDPSELDSFRKQGCLRLNGVHSKARMRTLKEKILSELARLGIRNGGRSAGASLQSLTPFQQIAKLSSMVKVNVHDVLGTSEIQSAIFGLTGRTPLAEQGSQLLLSLAHQGRWSLDSLNWHVDVASKPGDDIPGVQAFHLIDDVVPQGGATLALARSHRMTASATSRLRGSLKMPVDIQEVLLASDAEIIEMSGQAGDVFLMDMRVLHSPSVNASKNIRMMATTRFRLQPG